MIDELDWTPLYGSVNVPFLSPHSTCIPHEAVRWEDGLPPVIKEIEEGHS